MKLQGTLCTCCFHKSTAMLKIWFSFIAFMSDSLKRPFAYITNMRISPQLTFLIDYKNMNWLQRFQQTQLSVLLSFTGLNNQILNLLMHRVYYSLACHIPLKAMIENASAPQRFKTLMHLFEYTVCVLQSVLCFLPKKQKPRVEQTSTGNRFAYLPCLPTGREVLSWQA